MESDDDFELFSAAVTSPPVWERKLKRLKKASSFSVTVSLSKSSVIEQTNPNLNPNSPQSDPHSSDLQEPSCDKPHVLLSLAREKDNETEIVVGAAEGGLGVKRALDFGSLAIAIVDEELRNKNEDSLRSDPAFEINGGDLREESEWILNSEPMVEKADNKFRDEGEGPLDSDTVVGKADDEFREESKEGLRKEDEENHKRRSSWSFLEEDGEDSSIKKTRKDKKKEKVHRDNGHGDSDDDNFEACTRKRSYKRSEGMERRNHLKQLHVDSQRILRETRDASFKPIPMVHKPISSVLEKIRQRKLEISKKYASMKSSSFAYGDFDSPEDDVELDMKGDSLMKDLRVDGVRKGEAEKMKMDYVDALNGVEDMYKDSSNDCTILSTAEQVSSLRASHEDSKQEFRAPIDDTQDLFSDLQTKNAKEGSVSETPSSPLEGAFAPSLFVMNLKLDSTPADDLSEHDEGDNDKENVDPRPGQAIGFTLSPKGGDLKNFLDDEAEEEDDSDNDPMQSQEIKEEDEMEDVEELNEMIATNFKETGIDREKRNQLHQQWLEQQDAAGTEHLLQRLNFGSKQREANLLQDEEDGEKEEEEAEEEFGDGDAEDLVPANAVRMNLRRIKQMIPQMFTDKDDPYVSSDDEESERMHAKQSLCEKIQGKPTLLSPAEDESTRDAFQLIQKLNVPRDMKNRARPPTHYSMPLTGGNINGVQKSSFLGRASSSLPSSKRNKTSMTRLFVFGRDDSNTRGASLAMEDPTEMIEKESRPTKAPSAKFSGSQSKVSAQTTGRTAEVKPSPSLYDVLRHSSMKSDQCVQKTIVDRTGSIFAAFRLERSSRSGQVLF